MRSLMTTVEFWLAELYQGLSADFTSGPYFYISAFWMPLSVFLRLERPSYEVMQLEFEVDNVIDLVPTQTLHWNVEYPARTQTPSRQTEKVSHLYISNADIQGIVPLAEVRGNSPERRHEWQGSSTWQIKRCWNKLCVSLWFLPAANLLADTHPAICLSET